MRELSAAVAIGAGLLGLYALCSYSDDKKAEWQRKSQAAKDDITRHNQTINAAMGKARNIAHAWQLKSEHTTSVQLADKTYDLLQQARDNLAAIGRALVALREERDRLQQLNAVNELNRVRQARKALFADKDELLEQRNQLKAKLDELNLNSRRLKQAMAPYADFL